MLLLFQMYAKYLAVGCVLISLLLILRAFAVNLQSGQRRFGWKSISFFVFTLILVSGIRFAGSYRIEDVYDLVTTANTSVMADDAKYRASNAAFESSFQAYSDSLEKLQPGSDFRGDLIAIGKVAGKTRALGEALEAKYTELVEISTAYKATLTNAGRTYQVARSSLKYLATEEDASEYRSEMIRKLASKEEFQEISDAYLELAEVFEKLGQMSSHRLKEIEVTKPALEEAMAYVRSANKYLATVEYHSSSLGNFRSPAEILNDVGVFQEGVDRVMKAIRELNKRLDHAHPQTSS